MKPVFISYKSEEFDEAKWVKDYLENHGIECWMAPMCITGGASYAAEIPQAIREAQVFVLILSEVCQTSKWVPRELDQAINDEKVIMPFMIEECELKDEFQFYLTNVQRYPAYEDKEKTAEKMLREIEAELGIEHKDLEEEVVVSSDENKVKLKKEKPKKEKKQTKPKMKWKKLAVVGVAIIALLLVSTLIGELNKVTIAGQKVKKSAEYLKLTDVTVTQEDIDTISKLKKIQQIWFENCKIEAENLEPISKEKMYEIGFVSSGLKDAQFETIAFDKMEQLHTLCLYKNNISSLEPTIDVYDTLQSLNVSYTKIKDFKRIGNMKQLTTLCADGLEMTTLKEFKDLVHLKVLSVNKNRLSSFNGLEKCLSLECVFAGGNSIYDTDGLANATRLEVLYLNTNGVDESDLEFLKKSADTLEQLYVDGNYVDDLKFLENCVNLTCLSAKSNGITDISPLKNMQKLKKLSLKKNSVAEVDSLKKCQELRYVDLSENKIEDAEVLFQHERLLKEGFLDLSKNQIQSVSIEKQGSYFMLDIHGNQIRNVTMSEDVTFTHLVMDYLDGLKLEDLAKPKLLNFIIYQCPLDKHLDIQENVASNAKCYEEKINNSLQAELDEIKNRVSIGLDDIDIYLDSAVIF